MEDRIVVDLTHLKDISEIVYQQIKLVAKKSKYCTPGQRHKIKAEGHIHVYISVRA